MNKCENVLKQAIEDAKDKFIKFISGIYGIDENVFEHLLSIPIISPYDENFLIITPLSTKSADDIAEILGEHINKKLQDNYTCCINLDELTKYFDYSEIDEWENKLRKGKVTQPYHFIIGYNDTKLKKEFEDLTAGKQNVKTSETYFCNYVSNLILRQICVLNYNYIQCMYRNFENYGNLEDNNNKLLVEILVNVINSYEVGNNLEESLYKAIKKLSSEFNFQSINAKFIMAIYVVNFEDLTKWAIFGGYKLKRENILEEKINEVLSHACNIEGDELKQKLSAYISKTRNLASKQLKLLKMINI